MEEKFDFVIKNLLPLRILSWIFAGIGLLAVVLAPILYVTETIGYVIFIATISGGAIVAAGGAICVYGATMEKFEFKDGVFSYRKPFKKNQSARAQDINRVEVHGALAAAIIVNVVFYGENDKKLINFLDDGTAFHGGKFLKALGGLHIPILFK